MNDRMTELANGSINIITLLLHVGMILMIEYLMVASRELVRIFLH